MDGYGPKTREHTRRTKLIFLSNPYAPIQNLFCILIDFYTLCHLEFATVCLLVHKGVCGLLLNVICPVGLFPLNYKADIPLMNRLCKGRCASLSNLGYLSMISTSLRDEKAAHSIATAVEADATALEDIREEESRVRQDRCFVLRVSDEGPELENPTLRSSDA
jgi:hypothetical protein